MATTTQVESYGNGSLTTTTPPTLAVFGPGLQYYVIANGSGGQFAGLNLPPVALTPSQTGQTVDIGLVDAANNAVQLSAMNPPLTSPDASPPSLQGSSSALAQPVTVKAWLAGRQQDRTGYVVVDVTNNGASALALKGVVLSLLGVHFCRSRFFDISAATGDAYAYDATNQQLNLSNSGVTGVTIGLASNFGALSSVQHYEVTDTAINPLTVITGGGNLTDTATATATATKCAYLQIGDATHQVSIAAGTMTRFVFIVGVGATSGATTTLLNAAKSAYATDMTAFTSIASATRMQQTSPHPPLDLLTDYLLMKELYKGKAQTTLGGFTFSPAGSYAFFQHFGRDGYGGAQALAQAGAAATIKDEFALHLSVQAGTFAQQHKIGDQLQASGFFTEATNNGTPGDQDSFTLLKAYEYYIRTLDSAWLTANITAINNIASYLINWYYGTQGKSTDGAFCGHGSSTYLDSAGNVLTGQTYIVDPVMLAIVIHAVRAVVELNTAAGNTSIAGMYTAWRNTLLAAMPKLWNATAGWPVMNKSQDGTQVANNLHLMKLDALIFDALTDTSKQQAMLANLAGAGSLFWNATAVGFNMLPTTDALYSAGSYWYGPPWHLGDYKAFHVCFRYGTKAQAQWAWAMLKEHCERVKNTNLMSPAEHATDLGLFDFSAGSLVAMLVRGLWGIDAHAQYFTVAPNIGKLDTGETWKLTNLVMGGSTWTVTYSGEGPVLAVTLDGSPVSGNISYPSAGSHTLAITASGRGIVP